jgi:hypothetical protein
MANREYAPIRQKLQNDFALTLLQIAKTYIQLLGECPLDLDTKTFGSSSICFHRMTSPLPKAISDLHKNNQRPTKLLLHIWIDQSEGLSAVKTIARVHFRSIAAACAPITGEIIVVHCSSRARGSPQHKVSPPSPGRNPVGRVDLGLRDGAVDTAQL